QHAGAAGTGARSRRRGLDGLARRSCGHGARARLPGRARDSRCRQGRGLAAWPHALQLGRRAARAGRRRGPRLRASRLMRLLLTADPEIEVPPETYGGIERIVDVLVRRLRAQGHQVALAARPGSHCPADAFYPWPGLSSQSRADTVANGWALW